MQPLAIARYAGFGGASIEPDPIRSGNLYGQELIVIRNGKLQLSPTQSGREIWQTSCGSATTAVASIEPDPIRSGNTVVERAAVPAHHQRHLNPQPSRGVLQVAGVDLNLTALAA